MKHSYWLLSTLFTIQFSIAQIVDIPDANFKNALINTNCTSFDGSHPANTDIDTNNDGEIQVSEAEAAPYLTLVNQNINSLAGIEAFININELNASNNQLDLLDVSDLNELRILYLSNNLFSTTNNIIFPESNNSFTLDISNNQLINANNLPSTLYSLFCYGNQLTTLDLSLLSSAILDEFYIGNNPLTSLILPESAIHVELLICDNTFLTELDLNNITFIWELNCSNNPNLTSLDLSQTVVDYLTCRDNSSLETISLKNGHIDYTGGPFDDSSIDICNNPNLSVVCADEEEIEGYTYVENGSNETVTINGIQQLIDNCGYTNVVVSSDCTLGIDEFDYSDISMYPNPVKGMLNIKVENKIEFVTIYDLSGRLINQVAIISNTNEVSIKTDALTSGTYFVKVKTEVGEGVEKIIKE